ncbi:MAG: DUF6624 domain-containing protein [Acidobacteriota bacterium]
MSIYEAIFKADQEDRKGDPQTIDWDIVGPRDTARIARLKEAIRTAPPQSARECYCAAVVLLHTMDLETLDEARRLAREAFRLAPPDDLAFASLTAVSQDRWLLAQGRRQWYGTQKRMVNGHVELEPIDEDAVSDTERTRLGLSPLAEVRETLRRRKLALRAQQELQRRRQLRSS